MPYITRDFPIEFVNAIVHKEVQGKKPIYNLYRWWARRVGTTFRMMLLTALSRKLDADEADPRLLFYDSHPLSTPDGQPPIVLDPFMGGGTTIVEGLKLGCKVVGVDLNPHAFVEANLLRSSRGRYSPVPADRRGVEIAQRGKYRYDLDIMDHVYHLVKKGRGYPRYNVPELPPDRGWNDLLQRGQSLASALFMRTGDETYKKVRRTLERLGRDVGEEVALQRRLL